MSVIGLTRIRNEEAIIQDTLDHMSTFCDTVIVYDDCSTDRTVEICKKHQVVRLIVMGNEWDKNRWNAEYQNRHQLYIQAAKIANPNDFIVYMDADERIEFDWTILNETNADYITMKLFDFYITEEDKELDYSHRKWMGPEYRNIPMIFRMKAALGWHYPDQRICTTVPGSIELESGYVKHYGKSISVDEWEATCDYYIEYFPNYSEKWKARKGKAIHSDLSDFNRPLIQWHEKESCEFLHKLH